jgi:hypothetical protein
MSASVSLLGVYDSPRQAAAAAAALKTGGFGVVRTYGPTPDHELLAATSTDVSPVRLFVLIGGLLGCFIGFAFPIYTVIDWPLITSGKPLISIPPFVIIAFALTCLLGALAGILGFFALAGMLRLRRVGLYDARFTEDRFGVEVRCASERSAEAQSILAARGAEEIRREA